MKLYYSPGACSLSPHIALREAGLEFEIERVELATGKTAAGRTFKTINPKAYVPALELDDGSVLTEGAAIVQYVADQAPRADLAPAPGTLARARLQEHLNFIASELHKAFSPLFNAKSDAAAKRAATENVSRKFDFLEKLFGDGRDFLLGKTFSVADGYLFAVASWAGPTGIDLANWPKLAAFVQRVAARPKVKAALQAEGLDR